MTVNEIAKTAMEEKEQKLKDYYESIIAEQVQKIAELKSERNEMLDLLLNIGELNDIILPEYLNRLRIKRRNIKNSTAE